MSYLTLTRNVRPVTSYQVFCCCFCLFLTPKVFLEEQVTLGAILPVACIRKGTEFIFTSVIFSSRHTLSTGRLHCEDSQLIRLDNRAAMS